MTFLRRLESRLVELLTCRQRIRSLEERLRDERLRDECNQFAALPTAAARVRAESAARNRKAEMERVIRQIRELVGS